MSWAFQLPPSFISVIPTICWWLCVTTVLLGVLLLKLRATFRFRSCICFSHRSVLGSGCHPLRSREVHMCHPTLKHRPVEQAASSTLDATVRDGCRRAAHHGSTHCHGAVSAAQGGGQATTPAPLRCKGLTGMATLATGRHTGLEP